MPSKTKPKLLSTAQVERACILTKCRANLVADFIAPKKKKQRPSRYDWRDAIYADYSDRSEHELPADLQKKAAVYLIAEIDAELSILGVKT